MFLCTNLNFIVLSQLVANLVVKDGEVRQLSQIAKLKDESKGNEFVTETLQDSVTSFALLANLFVSEGKPGKFVKIGEDQFSLQHVTCGVPQGSVLGPFVFTVSINDLPNFVSNRTILYTDDTTLLTSGHDYGFMQIN
ncbi:hypothetical protein J6590_077969 [Homalodisca vitripennis]|nr:hypothetical protein J6590_077969 [Homalodisca vitripennis]